MFSSENEVHLELILLHYDVKGKSLGNIFMIL